MKRNHWLAIVMGASLAATPMVFAATNDARLPEAARQGDKAGVAAMLKQGIDVNSAAGDGSTALHWAANNGDLDMVKQLIALGANVNAGTRIGGMTPLYMAARKGNAAIISALLKAGAKAKEVNSNGTTVLMVAAASGDADSVRALIDAGAEVNAVDNTNGQTALMFAASLNRAATIKVLLERGATPNLTTKVFSLNRTPARPAAAPTNAGDSANANAAANANNNNRAQQAQIGRAHV